jgi:hypothetical protein
MGKIMKLIAAPLLVFMLGCTQAHAQVEANLTAATQSLRNAIVNYKETVSKSCKLWGGRYCELAALADVQILLLDIEYKYRQQAANSTTAEATEKAKATQNFASEARDLVNSLASSLN